MIGSWEPAGFISNSTEEKLHMEPWKASFFSGLDSAVEASGDIHVGSKGRVQESATNYVGGTLVSKTGFKKKKTKKGRFLKSSQTCLVFLNFLPTSKSICEIQDGDNRIKR